MIDQGGNEMTTELLEIMKEDIKRCKKTQSSNKGTYILYQALIAKYNGFLKDLEKIYQRLEKHVL